MHQLLVLMSSLDPGEISASCPWFFDMRNLIAQRPNLVPTGLGHSSTGVTPDVIIPAPAAAGNDTGTDELDDGASEASIPLPGWNDTPSPRHSLGPDGPSVGKKRALSELDNGVGSGDDYEPSSPVASESEPVDDADTDAKPIIAAVAAKPEPKTRPAKAATSTPAAPAQVVAPKPSKKTKLAEFSEIAKTEEKSRQKELELATLRTRQAMKTAELRVQRAERKEERKLAAKKMKYQYKELQARNAHELRMAREARGSVTASFFDGASSSGSHYASSEPTDYDLRDFDTFTQNAEAGPSNFGSTEYADSLAPGGVNS
jgi:hypothetical protein